MLGAIAGDIIGSTYEFRPWRGDLRELPLFPPESTFTDDTVMTVAVAQSILDEYLEGKDFAEALVDNFHSFGRRYPRAGYGGRFATWLMKGLREPYNSFGNGSAMRVSPVGWAWDSLEEVERMAGISAAVTHNHPEGIKGAQAVAGCIFLARTGHGKNELHAYVKNRFGYDVDRSLNAIRPEYDFDETCQGSVPEAIIAFLESDNYVDAVRKAVWLGGDADTQAAIAGSIAEAFYHDIPAHIAKEAVARLDPHLNNVLRQWQTWLESRE